MSHPNRWILLCGICILACASPIKADGNVDLAYLQAGVAARDTVYLQKALYRYTQSGRRETRRMLAAFPVLSPALESALAEVGVPDWLKYLPLAESRLESRAVSPVGAAGLWQIMPATARGLGLRINHHVDERLDTHKASRAAARYLKQLHARFDDWLLALAAYNCGVGNVRKAQRRSGGYYYHEISRYLPRQTRRYIPRFLTIARIAERPADFGFAPPSDGTPAVTVVVQSATTLRDLATYYCTTTRRLKRLNPALLTEKIAYTQVPLRILVPGEAYFSDQRVTVMRIAEHLAPEHVLDGPVGTGQEPAEHQMAAAGHWADHPFWRMF